jgi:hypothetical protein
LRGTESLTQLDSIRPPFIKCVTDYVDFDEKPLRFNTLTEVSDKRKFLLFIFTISVACSLLFMSCKSSVHVTQINLNSFRSTLFSFEYRHLSMIVRPMIPERADMKTDAGQSQYSFQYYSLWLMFSVATEDQKLMAHSIVCRWRAAILRPMRQLSTAGCCPGAVDGDARCVSSVGGFTNIFLYSDALKLWKTRAARKLRRLGNVVSILANANK